MTTSTTTAATYRQLSITQARARIRAGRLPVVTGTYSTRWDDDMAYVSAGVSLRLVAEGRLVGPKQTGPFTAGVNARKAVR